MSDGEQGGESEAKAVPDELQTAVPGGGELRAPRQLLVVLVPGLHVLPGQEASVRPQHRPRDVVVHHPVGGITIKRK